MSDASKGQMSDASKGQNSKHESLERHKVEKMEVPVLKSILRKQIIQAFMSREEKMGEAVW